MEEPNNHDNNEDVAIAVVAGGARVAVAAAAGGGAAVIDDAAADAVADVSNNEAVGVAEVEVEAAGNGDFDDEEEEEDANNEDDNAEDEDQLAIQKLLSVVQQRENFPVRQRNKIIELAHQFVNNLGADIKDMVTDQRAVADGYAGLDSNRDTKKEVETALRHYPETLSEPGGVENIFPIQCIITIDDRANRKWVSNLMAVSFVVLFANLAIEFNLFADEERGGLLATWRVGSVSHNTLIRLVRSSHKSCDKNHHQQVDTKFLEVLVQLRRSGLFKKEDIQRYELVHWVCAQTGYFAENRFQYLPNWDPSSLVQLNNYGGLPLHFSFATQTIRQFQVMLDCYFQYFTKEQVICCLFQNNNHGDTPFQRVCYYLHKDKTDTLVHDIIEQSLGTARFSSSTTTASSSSLNIGTGLLLMATSTANISLDGWYYFIRRQPDTMLSMLHHHRCCDDTASGVVSSLSSSTLSNNNNNDATSRNTGISHSSYSNSNTGTNDDGTNINRTDTNNMNNDGDTTLHNNHNVIVRRKTTRKRKQRN